MSDSENQLAHDRHIVLLSLSDDDLIEEMRRRWDACAVIAMTDDGDGAGEVLHDFKGNRFAVRGLIAELERQWIKQMELTDAR